MGYAPPEERISTECSLHRYGVALLDNLFQASTIEKWNTLIDKQSMEFGSEARSYISADELLQLGILSELLTEPLLSTIEALMPDALLYHCHYYRIPGNQTTTHIHAKNGLKGWHRDDDCFYGWEPKRFHFISYFLYLTPVREASGPFEIAPIAMNEPLRNGARSTKILGDPGCNFIFDRTFWHRATPNMSSEERRVIKLSFQNSYLPNDKIDLPEFEALRRSRLNTQPIINKWLNRSTDYHVTTG